MYLVQHETYGYLPSCRILPLLSSLLVLIFHPTEGRKLNWLQWHILKQYTFSGSHVSVLTGLDIHNVE